MPDRARDAPAMVCLKIGIGPLSRGNQKETSCKGPPNFENPCVRLRKPHNVGLLFGFLGDKKGALMGYERASALGTDQV